METDYFTVLYEEYFIRNHEKRDNNNWCYHIPFYRRHILWRTFITKWRILNEVHRNSTGYNAFRVSWVKSSTTMTFNKIILDDKSILILTNSSNKNEN